MRSDLVFGVMTNIPNRFLLSQLASKATRKLHRSGTRMQDTTNDVLVRFSRANPIGCEQALRERPVAPLLPKTTPPFISHRSKAVTLTPTGENSLTRRSHLNDNSPTTTLGFHTYSDIGVS
jgi:hypothetical protein